MAKIIKSNSIEITGSKSTALITDDCPNISLKLLNSGGQANCKILIKKEHLADVIDVLNDAYNELFAPTTAKYCDKCQKNPV